MAADDMYPTCYGLEPVTDEPKPAKPEPEPEPAPEPEAEPEPAEPGFITQVEEAVVALEEIAEPRTWVRRGAFGLARLIRRKLR